MTCRPRIWRHYQSFQAWSPSITMTIRTADKNLRSVARGAAKLGRELEPATFPGKELEYSSKASAFARCRPTQSSERRIEYCCA